MGTACAVASATCRVSETSGTIPFRSGLGWAGATACDGSSGAGGSECCHATEVPSGIARSVSTGALGGDSRAGPVGCAVAAGATPATRPPLGTQDQRSAYAGLAAAAGAAGGGTGDKEGCGNTAGAVETGCRTTSDAPGRTVVSSTDGGAGETTGVDGATRCAPGCEAACGEWLETSASPAFWCDVGQPAAASITAAIIVIAPRRDLVPLAGIELSTRCRQPYHPATAKHTCRCNCRAWGWLVSIVISPYLLCLAPR